MKHLKLITPVLLFILMLLSNSSYSQTGWQMLNPSPTRYGYSDIKMFNDNNGLAFGDNNTVSKTINGGETWILKNSGIPLAINDNAVYINQSSFLDKYTGYIGGNYLFKTINGGESWSFISSNINGLYFDNLKFISTNRGFTYSYGFYETSNGGVTWNQHPAPVKNTGNPNFKAAQDFIDGNTGFLAGNNGILLKTINGGVNWTQILDSNSSNPFFKIKFFNSTTGIAITTNGKIFKTTTSGNNWILQSTFSQNYYGYEVNILNENYMILSGYGPQGVKFYRTTDGGMNWSEFTSPGLYGGSRFDLTPSGVLFQCTDRGLIFKSVDNTQTWQCKTSKIGYIGDITCVKFLNSNTGFMGCNEGLILRTTDSGVNFSLFNLNDTKNVQSISFVNNNVGFCATWNAIYKTLNGGNSWSMVSRLDTLEYVNIKFYDEQNGIAVAYTDFGESGIYKTQDGGITWSLKRAGAYIKGFDFINEQTGFISSSFVRSFPHGGTQDYTRFYKTTDKGDTWEYLTEVEVNITAIGFINSLTGFAASPNYGVSKTTDGGLTWVSTLYHSIANKIQFVNSTTGYIGGKLKTTNGGETWFSQNFEGTTFDYVNAQVGFGGGYGGYIVKTIDGGGPLGIQNNPGIFAGYNLFQNYPNPFNPETKIQFSIPKNGLVKIAVYDLLGREVKQLVNEFRQSGIYNVSFNGADLSSGIYFYKLITDDFVETKKMILIK